MLVFATMAVADPDARPAERSSKRTQTTVSDDTEEMVASWYGERFRGRSTANGESYDPDGLTAAHKTLPFGTRLKVTYPVTGRSVVVRVNDRGPFIEGRSLDLSKGAAAAIGIRDKGVDTVLVERL